MKLPEQLTLASEALGYEQQLSLGQSVLAANQATDGMAVITGNYVSPNYELPLPWPDGDWYLRQSFVPATHNNEAVVCHTLIPGLQQYYRRVGLLPEDAVVIEIEPKLEDGLLETRYGFPYTDPLEILKNNVVFEGESGKPLYLCSTFDSDEIAQQAQALGMLTLERAPSNLTNHKSRLRAASGEAGFTMLPGSNLQTWDDIPQVVSSPWNTELGSWLKFPTGSGGDLVIHIPGVATCERLQNAVIQLRQNVNRAFEEASFSTAFHDFWPENRLSPVGYPLVLEADANVLGELVANGSTQFLTGKSGEVEVIGHFSQMTTDAGEYLGNEPYTDIDNNTKRAAEEQATLVANYNANTHGYYGIAAIDWFVTRDSNGNEQLSVVELNARPTANTPPVIIAQKLRAPHFVNTNVYTNTPVNTVEDYIGIIGPELAYGEPHGEGLVVPQAFRTLVHRRGNIASPDFKIAILGKDSEHCRNIIRTLGSRGIKFTP